MDDIKASFVLFEGALNDDELYVANDELGYHFKSGNGKLYKFRVVYWTYVNEWCNRMHEFHSNSLEAALNRYQKETHRLTDDVRDSVLYCEM
jgi:hypothetical protein